MARMNSTNSEHGESSIRLLWPIWTTVAVILIGIGWRILVPPDHERGANKMNNDHQRLIDGYLTRIEMSRGKKFTAQQRDRIYEVAQMDLFRVTLGRIPDLPPNEQDKVLEGIVRMALVGLGETLPVATEITASVLAETSDADLPQMLFDFVCKRQLDRRVQWRRRLVSTSAPQAPARAACCIYHVCP